MFAFFVCVSVLLIAAFIIYLPAIYSKFKLAEAKRTFEEQKALLPDLYSSCVIIITFMLGTGGSQNSAPQFKSAHKNQDFAVRSIMDIMDYFGG